MSLDAGGARKMESMPGEVWVAPHERSKEYPGEQPDGAAEEVRIDQEGENNNEHFETSEQPELLQFDKLLDAVKDLPPGPERNKKEAEIVAVQKKILNQAFEQMGAVTREVPDLVMFGSTAKFLNGEVMNEEGEAEGDELKVKRAEKLRIIPNDIDGVVQSKESLVKVRNLLLEGGNFVPDSVQELDERGRPVIDENGEPVLKVKPGEFMKLPDGVAEKLSGKLMYKAEIDGQTVDVGVEVEVFLNSFVIPQELADSEAVEFKSGIKALSIKGLREQNRIIKEFEEANEDKVENAKFNAKGEQIEGTGTGKAEYLMTDAVKSLRDALEKNGEPQEGSPLSEELRQLAERLEVSPEDLKEALGIQYQILSMERQPQSAARLSKKELASLVDAHISLGREDRAQHLKEQFDEAQKLFAKRAVLLTGLKTKVAKRRADEETYDEILAATFPKGASSGEGFEESIPANGDMGDAIEAANAKMAA